MSRDSAFFRSLGSRRVLRTEQYDSTWLQSKCNIKERTVKGNRKKVRKKICGGHSKKFQDFWNGWCYVLDLAHVLALIALFVLGCLNCECSLFRFNGFFSSKKKINLNIQQPSFVLLCKLNQHLKKPRPTQPVVCPMIRPACWRLLLITTRYMLTFSAVRQVNCAPIVPCALSLFLAHSHMHVTCISVELDCTTVDLEFTHLSVCVCVYLSPRQMPSLCG